MRNLCMMVLLANILMVFLGQAGGADGIEAAAPWPRRTVANDIVAVTLCTFDGKPKLLALRREQISPEPTPEGPGHFGKSIALLSAELYPIVQGGFDSKREAVIWQDWHEIRRETYRGHDSFSFVTDPMTGKPYLVWAHALEAIGSLSVNELDLRATLTPAAVVFVAAGIEGLPVHPKDLIHIRYAPITYIHGVAGAYTAGPGGNPSLMLYPKMGDTFDRFEIPVLRVDLTSKKLYYSDGREVKLDEGSYVTNSPPRANATPAPPDAPD